MLWSVTAARTGAGCPSLPFCQLLFFDSGPSPVTTLVDLPHITLVSLCSWGLWTPLCGMYSSLSGLPSHHSLQHQRRLGSGSWGAKICLFQSINSMVCELYLSMDV